jgi:hypothetical protein
MVPKSMDELQNLLPNRKQRALFRGSGRAAAIAGTNCNTIRFDLALVVGPGGKEKRPTFQPDVIYFPSVFSAG